MHDRLFQCLFSSKFVMFIQSRSLVYLHSSFDKNSFVIKKAIDVNRAVELDIVKPTFGFNVANVLEHIVEADLIKISVLIKNIFVFHALFYTSFHKKYRQF